MANFIRADSDNLPRFDGITVLEYATVNNKFSLEEIRAAKRLMSSREFYMLDAIGYVKIKREFSVCEVKAKILPEHEIANKYHTVSAQINESDESIIATTCDGCPHACRHSLLLLYWLVNKSSYPAPSSVQSFWHKPILAMDCPFIKAKDLRYK